MAMTAAHVKQYNVLSPIDELRHVDYAMRVTEGELPKLGDLLRRRRCAPRRAAVPTSRSPTRRAA